jgi:hypothetical protein
VNNMWCRIAGVFLTANANKINLHQLEIIKEQFNLAGSLLS